MGNLSIRCPRSLKLYINTQSILNLIRVSEYFELSGFELSGFSVSIRMKFTRQEKHFYGKCMDLQSVPSAVFLTRDSIILFNLSWSFH